MGSPLESHEPPHLALLRRGQRKLSKLPEQWAMSQQRLQTLIQTHSHMQKPCLVLTELSGEQLVLKKWNNLSIRIFLTWFPNLKAIKWLTVNRYSRQNWVLMDKSNTIKLAWLQKSSLKSKALTSMRHTHLLLVIPQSGLYLLSHAQIAGTSTKWMQNQPS